jgi:type VI secretion system secreted protein VgrG
VTSTAQSTHIASDGNTALTTGRSLSITSEDSLFASIRETVRLFVQKAGMKLVASAGDIDMQALSDSINLLAKLNITQSATTITISARENIVINGGGSYVKFSASGIEHGTNGTLVAHAATHSFVEAKTMDVNILVPSQGGHDPKGSFIFSA